MMDDSKYIGQRVREERRRMGLTQAGLAEKSSLSTQYICQIETGNRNASLSALISISKALELPAGTLLYDAGSPNDHAAEIAELLADCNDSERKIIFETISALKDSLKNNRM